nr:hypothetical protein [Tanacetum cinerariifolium]
MDQAKTSQNLTPRKVTHQLHQEDPILNIKTYFPDFSQPQPIKPRPSFDNEADYGKTHDDPYSGRFDEYNKKPSRDFTRPLGPPDGLKDLLHMLNATVIPTKDTLVKSLSLAIIIRRTLYKPSGG